MHCLALPCVLFSDIVFIGAEESCCQLATFEHRLQAISGINAAAGPAGPHSSMQPGELKKLTAQQGLSSSVNRTGWAFLKKWTRVSARGNPGKPAACSSTTCPLGEARGLDEGGMYPTGDPKAWSWRAPGWEGEGCAWAFDGAAASWQASCARGWGGAARGWPKGPAGRALFGKGAGL